MSRQENTYRCTGTIMRETEKAVLFDTGEKQVWIPFSQITEIHRKAHNGADEIEMSQWIAEQKELI